MESHVLPVPRDDLPLAVGLPAPAPTDTSGDAPFIAQPSPDRVAAPFGHLPAWLPQATEKRTSSAKRPGRVEDHDGVGPLKTEVECLVVVAVGYPCLARK